MKDSRVPLLSYGLMKVIIRKFKSKMTKQNNCAPKYLRYSRLKSSRLCIMLVKKSRLFLTIIIECRHVISMIDNAKGKGA